MLPHASKADLDRALDAGQSAASRFGARRRLMSARKCCGASAALLRERQEQIATLLTLDQGKPITEIASGSRIRGRLISNGMPMKAGASYGRLIPSRNPRASARWSLREPVGPVAAFTPWNFPINLPARKISSSLAAGCSCIIKPAEETPGASTRACPRGDGCRRAAGCPQHGVRRAGGGVVPPDRFAGHQEDHLHRLDRGRQAARSARRRWRQARHHGAGAVMRPSWSSRMSMPRRSPRCRCRTSSAIPARSACRRRASTSMSASTRNSSTVSVPLPNR